MDCMALSLQVWGVSLQPLTAQVPLPHPDVRPYAVMRGGDIAAYLFLDARARPDKTGSGWSPALAPVVPPALPLVHVLGRTPASGMTWAEVEGLFDAMGEALGQTLSAENRLEQWAAQKGTLLTLVASPTEGSAMPTDLLAKVAAAAGLGPVQGAPPVEVYPTAPRPPVPEGFYDENLLDKFALKLFRLLVQREIAYVSPLEVRCGRASPAAGGWTEVAGRRRVSVDWK